MAISWFVTFRNVASEIGEHDLARLAGILRGLAGVSEALLFTPARTQDPYLDDGTPPALVIQCTFETIEMLEASAGENCAELHSLQSLRDASIAEQAMLTRVFPVAAKSGEQAVGSRRCTYLVAYEGEAADMNAWLAHYITHHPPIMARFPGIRQIEIYTRLDWCSATGWARETAMQRNKVVFDDPDALTAALNSPVRHEMRADFARFPPFTGRTTHFPMWTTRVV